MDLPIRRRHDDEPQQEFERLRKTFAGQLDRWPDFVRAALPDVLPNALHDVLPPVDVEETDDSFVLHIELPDVRRQDVDLEVESGRLRLTAERRERRRVGLLRHRTRTTGRYALALTLPGPVAVERITAALDQGLLTVVVPKTEQARRRRIPVRLAP